MRKLSHDLSPEKMPLSFWILRDLLIVVITIAVLAHVPAFTKWAFDVPHAVDCRVIPMDETP